MRKKFSLLFVLSIILLMSACNRTSNEVGSSSSAGDTAATSEAAFVVITSFNAEKKLVEVKIPRNPQRVAVMDMPTLDMLDNWGLGDRVVGISKGTQVNYLKSYFDNESIRNLGTLHEADLEAVMMVKPDVIFIGNRMAPQYNALSKIAPIVYLGLDYKAGLVACMKNNVGSVAKIFGKEEMAEASLNDFDARISALGAKLKGKTAIIGVVTSGSFNTLGNSSRGSLIGGEIGLQNLANTVDATHGNESSFELLVQLNPDYIFVLDRDTAISTGGAKLAKEVMENELVKKTDAYKNNRIVYLTPTPWYVVEGGITAMNLMLSDLENI